MNVMRCMTLQKRLMGGHSDRALIYLFMILLINRGLMSYLRYIKGMHVCLKNLYYTNDHFPQPGQQ